MMENITIERTFVGFVLFLLNTSATPKLISGNDHYDDHEIRRNPISGTQCTSTVCALCDNFSVWKLTMELMMYFIN